MFWGSHNPQNKNTGKLDKKENLENKSKRMYPTVKGGPASKQVMAKRKKRIKSKKHENKTELSESFFTSCCKLMLIQAA